MSPVQPIVMKFGGAALADGAGVRRALELVRERLALRPIVVVSATLGATDLLERAAREAARGQGDASAIRLRHRTLLSQLGLEQELLDRLLRELQAHLETVRAKRELQARDHDGILSFGERMSARILAAALRARGVEATPVDAFDLGLVSDSNHGRARPLPGAGARIAQALEHLPGVPIVTGFVAADEAGNLTTLGRNGSDLSAALIGEAVGAREVCFWKTVAGVMTADPALVPTARTVSYLSFDDAAELAWWGAKVLHPDALAPLARARVPARVACVEDGGARATAIGPEPSPSGALALALRPELLRARFALLADESEARAKRARLLADLGAAELSWITLEARADALELVAPWSEALGAFCAQRSQVLALERELAALAAPGLAAPDAARLARQLAEIEPALEARLFARTSWFLVSGANAARALERAHELLFGARAERSISEGALRDAQSSR